MRNIFNLLKKLKKENLPQEAPEERVKTEATYTEQEKKRKLPIPLPMLVLLVFVVIAVALAAGIFLQNPQEKQPPMLSVSQPTDVSDKPSLPPLPATPSDTSQPPSPTSATTPQKQEESVKEPKTQEPKPFTLAQDSKTTTSKIQENKTATMDKPKDKPQQQDENLKSFIDEMYALKLKEEKLKRQLAIAELERKIKYGDQKVDTTPRDIRDVVNTVRREVNTTQQFMPEMVGIPPAGMPPVTPHSLSVNSIPPVPVSPQPLLQAGKVNVVGVVNDTAIIEISGSRRIVKGGDTFGGIEVVSISKGCVTYNERKTVMKKDKKKGSIPTEIVETNTVCVN